MIDTWRYASSEQGAGGLIGVVIAASRGAGNKSKQGIVSIIQNLSQDSSGEIHIMFYKLYVYCYLMLVITVIVVCN